MSVDTAFYATTAQIVPVLLITLAVERQFLERSEEQSTLVALWFVMGTTGSLVVSEIAALAGVAGWHSRWLAALIAFTLGLGSWLIVGWFVFDYYSRAIDAAARREMERPLATGCSGACATLLAVVVGFLPLVAGVVFAVRLLL
jgi:4-hydroxybenzoate polyprenyltransferase